MSEASAIALAKAEEEKLASHVHIEWTGIGAKHINTEEGSAFLIPKSVTPVHPAVWEIARPWLVGLIIKDPRACTEAELNDGRLIEHGFTVDTVVVPPKKGPGGKILEEGTSSTKITSAKDLQDMEDSVARALIAKIFDIAILQEYLTSSVLDASPGLKGAIERRIVEIEKKGAKKAAK